MNEPYTSVKQCLDCESKTVVIDSRVRENGAIWRKRKCTNCGYIFTTLELEESMIDVLDLVDELRAVKKEVKALKAKMEDARKLLA